MVIMTWTLLIAVVAFGVLFLRLHTLPERIAHSRHKLQLEIVAVLGLLALFTHIHLFWVAGLLLALIDLPDFGGWLSRIAAAVERIAGGKPGKNVSLAQDDADAPSGGADTAPPAAAKKKARIHA